jgi:hypothetical protein
MAKALPSFMYRDPSDVVDRIRASEAAQAKRKAERKAYTDAEWRSGLTEEEMKLIPVDWVRRK